MKCYHAILVIEDEEDIRQMICDILEEEGYETLQASNGIEGLHALQHSPGIGIIITDLIMPEKEGIETIAEIRRDFPSVRILAISGGGIGMPENYLNHARALGANLTLSKPFGRNELLNAVEHLER